MLSEAEKREVDAELMTVPTRQAASIGAMKRIQASRGWISDATLADLADYLELSTAELEGVATFYNLIFRRPVGRHVILVCDSISCWVLGCTKLQSRLHAQLGTVAGEATEDGRFTYIPMACLGACDKAPVLMVDDDLHTHVDPDALGSILEAYP